MPRLKLNRTQIFADLHRYLYLNLKVWNHSLRLSASVAMTGGICPKGKIFFLSVYICVNPCPIKYYLAPLPKRTIFMVRKMIIRSIKTDMFLI